MDKKEIMSTVYKNKYLIMICAVLILGTFFGTSIAETLPEDMGEKILKIIANEPKDFFKVFINRFSFPFMILLCVFISGNSLFGKILVPSAIFINGAVFGLENALNNIFLGRDHIFYEVITYFTSTLFFCFFNIIMAENSVFSACGIINAMQGKISEKPHYNAKILAVKFIAFTVVFLLISAFSAYIFILLPPLL